MRRDKLESDRIAVRRFHLDMASMSFELRHYTGPIHCDPREGPTKDALSVSSSKVVRRPVVGSIPRTEAKGPAHMMVRCRARVNLTARDHASRVRTEFKPGFQVGQSPRIRGWTLRPISNCSPACRRLDRAQKNKSYELGRGSASFDRFLSVIC